MISGGLPINKEDGPTSFQVTNRANGLYCASKAGHMGTLDPHARGVLVVLFGASTKIIPYAKEHKKSYTAKFKLGFTTNTYDAWGQLTEHGYNGDTTKEHIEAILSQFIGKTEQIPPMFSAKKIEGTRLYELAMKGIELPRKPQPIEIDELKLNFWDQSSGEGEFNLTCTKGTYVRSLISDIGIHAGCGAIMTALTRTSDQGFNLEQSVSISKIEEHVFEGTHLDLIIPPEHFLSHLPEVRVSTRQQEILYHGNPVNLRSPTARAGLAKIFGSKEKLVGIGKYVPATGQLLPERML